MAEESDSGEKTEEATVQRRLDFRKRGQVAQTKELSTVLFLFGAAIVIWLLGRYFLEQISLLFTKTMGHFVLTAARDGDWTAAVIFAAKKILMLIVPILGVFGILALTSSVVQIGFLTSSEALKPKLDKLNPISGLKRIFSLRSLFEGLKAVLKVSMVAFVAYLITRKEFVAAPMLMQMQPSQLLMHFSSVVVRLVLGVGSLMAVLALIDYAYQKWELEKKMKMTKQEVKEEVKSREGDPQIKARIRRIQRDLATRRMMEAVPTADVVVTNPTHIAVAIKYGAELPAPQVVAKGADIIAEKIKEIAKENKVPIVENKPLARTMFKTIKIGQIIPRELFNAVAEVLAYVYKLKRKVVS